jgi:hypothetical protein
MEVEMSQCEIIFWHMPTGTEEKHESPHPHPPKKTNYDPT